MAAHNSLTGSDLHEPKGIEAASINTVYVADGAGTGNWSQVPADALDTFSVKNLNKFRAFVQLADISSPDVILIAFPEEATLNKCTVILNNAITLADSTLTFTNSTGPSAMGTLSIPFTGSAEGSQFTFIASTNNIFTAGTYMKIALDGNSTTVCKATLLLEWTLT